VVEDNMIVALEAEELLRELGFASAESVPSVAAALDRIAGAQPDFALLDVNLGRETSFAVADRLAELGVPFAFATGYGEQAAVPVKHQGRPRLSKPFNSQALRRFLDDPSVPVRDSGTGGA
jgi:CheY-like chemotaxis protein